MDTPPSGLDGPSALEASAAFTLRNIDGLTDGDVAPLLSALSAGEQWVAPALGRTTAALCARGD